MNKVVKLILVCQAKDDIIPQLIPLIWMLSILVWILIILVLLEIYYYREEYNLKNIESIIVEERVIYIW